MGSKRGGEDTSSRNDLLLDVLVPIVGFLAGFTGSIYSSNIHNAFPFNSNTWFVRPTPSTISGPASAFWALLVTFSVLLAMQQTRLHQRRKVDQVKQTKQISDLQRVLGTMPPVDFMDALSFAIQDCDTYIITQKAIADEVAAYDADDPSLNEAIDLARDRRNQARFILYNMVSLASQWDRTLTSGAHGAVYRANVMLFRSKDYLGRMNSTSTDALFDAARFIEGDDAQAAFASLDGILEVDQEMTFRDTVQLNSNTDGSPDRIPHDDEVKPFALGVSLTERDGSGALPNLPGAPEAFVTQKPSVVLDTQAIAEHCRNLGCFSETEISEISRYYEMDTKGRSIISWPIKDARGEPIAVINIYRDKEEISLDEIRAKRLVGILEPFTLMFRDILADISE